jgi:hypothetical protein
MAVRVLLSALVLRSLGVSAVAPLTQAGMNLDAVLSPRGQVVGTATAEQKSAMIRRERKTDDTRRKSLADQFYGVSDLQVRSAKVKNGLAYSAGVDPDQEDDWRINDHNAVEKWVKNQGNPYAAPHWEPHSSMPSMPTCKIDVGTNKGLSDYGVLGHKCTACSKTTEENKQLPMRLTWLFEPKLSVCNAFDVNYYANLSNIRHLNQAATTEMGIQHKFEVDFATNAGKNMESYGYGNLKFKGWFGLEVGGGAHGPGEAFKGYHVVEVFDTLPPSNNCHEDNPSQRFLVIPGAGKMGESWNCERICHSPPCKCDRKTGVRCTTKVAMNSNQLFKYRVRSTASSSTVSYDGHSWQGPEWTITAQDISHSQEAMVVARIVLNGNDATHGIEGLAQTHGHLGTVPCDMFYESVIASGPFISDPPGVHVVRSADGDPPPLSAQSCELYRLSSLGGYSVQFESGPGLWPPSQINDTIFTCSHLSANSCPVN